MVAFPSGFAAKDDAGRLLCDRDLPVECLRVLIVKTGPDFKEKEVGFDVTTDTPFERHQSNGVLVSLVAL